MTTIVVFRCQRVNYHRIHTFQTTHLLATGPGHLLLCYVQLHLLHHWFNLNSVCFSENSSWSSCTCMRGVYICGCVCVCVCGGGLRRRAHTRVCHSTIDSAKKCASETFISMSVQSWSYCRQSWKKCSLNVACSIHVSMTWLFPGLVLGECCCSYGEKYNLQVHYVTCVMRGWVAQWSWKPTPFSFSYIEGYVAFL